MDTVEVLLLLPPGVARIEHEILDEKVRQKIRALTKASPIIHLVQLSVLDKRDPDTVWVTLIGLESCSELFYNVGKIVADVLSDRTALNQYNIRVQDIRSAVALEVPHDHESRSAKLYYISNRPRR